MNQPFMYLTFLFAPSKGRTKSEVKNSGKPKLSGVKITFLTLGELRCATGCLQTVLLNYGRLYPFNTIGLRA